MTMRSNLLLAAAAAAAFLISAFIAGNLTTLSSPASDSEKYSNRRDGVILIPIPGAVGPESLAFDSFGGGPYTGVSDGRIIKWEEKEGRWIDFATTTSKRCVISYLIINSYSTQIPTFLKFGLSD